MAKEIDIKIQEPHGSMFNINMFLLLTDAIPLQSLDGHDAFFQVKNRKGLLGRLCNYFWKKAQRTLEIQGSGIYAGESESHYFIYFDNSL